MVTARGSLPFFDAGVPCPRQDPGDLRPLPQLHLRGRPCARAVVSRGSSRIVDSAPYAWTRYACRVFFFFVGGVLHKTKIVQKICAQACCICQELYFNCSTWLAEDSLPGAVILMLGATAKVPAR